MLNPNLQNGGFTEWQMQRSDLSDFERSQLDQVRQRFRYQREMGQVAEGTVNAIVVSKCALSCSPHP